MNAKIRKINDNKETSMKKNTFKAYNLVIISCFYYNDFQCMIHCGIFPSINTFCVRLVCLNSIIFTKSQPFPFFILFYLT